METRRKFIKKSTGTALAFGVGLSLDSSFAFGSSSSGRVLVWLRKKVPTGSHHADTPQALLKDMWENGTYWDEYHDSALCMEAVFPWPHTGADNQMIYPENGGWTCVVFAGGAPCYVTRHFYKPAGQTGPYNPPNP
jgi:hypothetical protein